MESTVTASSSTPETAPDRSSLPASRPPLRVDPADLRHVAGRIRAAAAEADAAVRHPAALRSSIAQLGPPEVVRSLAVFVAGWNSALATVVADANRMAEAVALVARDYEDAERLVDGLFPW